MRTSSSIPILFFAFVAACGSDETPEPPAPPPPPIDAADFMAAYTSALCDRSARCLPTAGYLDESCKADVEASFGGEDVDAAIAAGRIVYDADAAGACVAGLAAMDCLAEQPSDATLAACLGALSGTVQKEKPCFGTFECAEGVCRSVTGDTCPTVCAPAAQKGEACSLLSGPDCDVRKGLRCSGGVCVAPLGEDGACVDNYGCQSGFVCVADVCEPLRETGFGCAKDSSCAPGNFCIAEGDEGGICEPRVAEGGACGRNAEETNAAFRRVLCQPGLVCLGAGVAADGTSIAGTCAKAVDEGESCTVVPEGFQLFDTGCKDGLVCEAGKCEKPRALGAPCSAFFPCRAGEAYCEPMTLVCTALVPNGEACTFDFQCAGGLCGSMGTCTDVATFCGP